MAERQSTRTPILEEALRAISRKTPIGSTLRSADWEQVPLGLRNAGQFSAAVQSVRLLQTVQDRIKGQLAQQREKLANGQQATFDRSSFIDEIRSLAREEGIDTRMRPEDTGTIVDIQSIPRLGLIYDTQTAMAQGFSRWKLDNTEGALLLYPAARFERTEDRKDPRPAEFWPDRWNESAAKVSYVGVSKEEMVALKTSPIWQELSRFGNPYPPFDFQSGWGMTDVDYDEAVSLGLLRDGEIPKPSGEKSFNDNLEASVKGIDPELVNQLGQFFGGQIRRKGELLEWEGD